MAKGEFLTFIDSDDLVAPEYLNRLYHSIKSSAAEISICNMLPFKDGSNPQIEEQNSNDSKRIISGRDACLSIYRMDGTVPIMAWGKLYKSSLFNGIRYPVGLIHEDDATTPKLFYLANKIAQIGDKLYLYRSRAEGRFSLHGGQNARRTVRQQGGASAQRRHRKPRCRHPQERDHRYGHHRSRLHEKEVQLRTV